MPMTSIGGSCRSAPLATARMTAFNPGQSPPAVSKPTRRVRPMQRSFPYHEVFRFSCEKGLDVGDCRIQDALERLPGIESDVRRDHDILPVQEDMILQ